MKTQYLFAILSSSLQPFYKPMGGSIGSGWSAWSKLSKGWRPPGAACLRATFIRWTGWTLAVAVHCYDDSSVNIVVAITITIISVQPPSLPVCLSVCPVGVPSSRRKRRTKKTKKRSIPRAGVNSVSIFSSKWSKVKVKVKVTARQRHKNDACLT